MQQTPGAGAGAILDSTMWVLPEGELNMDWREGTELKNSSVKTGKIFVVLLSETYAGAVIQQQNSIKASNDYLLTQKILALLSNNSFGSHYDVAMEPTHDIGKLIFHTGKLNTLNQ